MGLDPKEDGEEDQDEESIYSKINQKAPEEEVVTKTNKKKRRTEEKVGRAGYG